jgi:Flp pilus assembly pilin Flp
MKYYIRWITSRGFRRDTQGQDLIEYALMVGFVAIAAVAVMPTISTSIKAIFDKVAVLLAGYAA